MTSGEQGIEEQGQAALVWGGPSPLPWAWNHGLDLFFHHWRETSRHHSQLPVLHFKVETANVSHQKMLNEVKQTEILTKKILQLGGARPALGMTELV